MFGKQKGTLKRPFLNVVLTAMRPKSSRLLSHHVSHERTFKVARFVFVDDILLGQPVNHGGHLREVLSKRLLVCGGTELPQGIPHGFVVIPVAETLGLIGTNALEGRFVVRHTFSLEGGKYRQRFDAIELQYQIK